MCVKAWAVRHYFQYKASWAIWHYFQYKASWAIWHYFQYKASWAVWHYFQYKASWAVWHYFQGEAFYTTTCVTCLLPTLAMTMHIHIAYIMFHEVLLRRIG